MAIGRVRLSELEINQTMCPRSAHHRGLGANQSSTPVKHGTAGGQVAEEHAHEPTQLAHQGLARTDRRKLYAPFQ